MSGAAAPGRPAPGRAGTVVTASILVLGHTVTAYFTWVAYMINPDGPWDRDAVAYSGLSSGIALFLSFLVALLTTLFVKARWLRRWWYAAPVLFGVAAVLRWTLLAPEL